MPGVGGETEGSGLRLVRKRFLSRLHKLRRFVANLVLCPAVTLVADWSTAGFSRLCSSGPDNNRFGPEGPNHKQLKSQGLQQGSVSNRFGPGHVPHDLNQKGHATEY